MAGKRSVWPFLCQRYGTGGRKRNPLGDDFMPAFSPMAKSQVSSARLLNMNELDVRDPHEAEDVSDSRVLDVVSFARLTRPVLAPVPPGHDDGLFVLSQALRRWPD